VRKQLRPFYDEQGLARVYARGYDHTRWPDHIQRVKRTAEMLAAMQPSSVADLSCGDAGVVNQAGLGCPVWLGDLTGDYEFRGPIEKTILTVPPVDVFVCSETLEHLRDPDLVLRLIRGKAQRLLLSTPAGETGDENPEHYWGWTPEDMRVMLSQAGWTPDGPYPQDQPDLFWPAQGYYVFQIWSCR